MRSCQYAYVRVLKSLLLFENLFLVPVVEIFVVTHVLFLVAFVQLHAIAISMLAAG